jgi:hypothetical protein
VKGIPDYINPDLTVRNGLRCTLQSYTYSKTGQKEQSFGDHEETWWIDSSWCIRHKKVLHVCIRGYAAKLCWFHLFLFLFSKESPVLKSAEARLLAAITAEVDAEHGCQLPKIDTRQAFLYGDMEHAKVYIQPHDWWPDSIPKAIFPNFSKSIYDTKRQ